MPAPTKQQIRDLQFLMKGNNRHQINAYQGKVDGLKGDRTNKGILETKFWLGYPKKYINKSMDRPKLRGYLVRRGIKGYRRLPAAYRLRREARIRLKNRPKRSYPLERRGKLIGFPYQGTHTRGNWQSDRGYDIGIPQGTKILAIENGRIGHRWGSLGKGGVLYGMRIYLENTPTGNEYYYAHAMRLIRRPGDRVQAGDVIAISDFPSIPHLHITCRYGSPSACILGDQLRGAFSRIMSLLGEPEPELVTTMGDPHVESPLVDEEDLEEQWDHEMPELAMINIEGREPDDGES